MHSAEMCMPNHIECQMKKKCISVCRKIPAQSDFSDMQKPGQSMAGLFFGGMDTEDQLLWNSRRS